MLGLRIESLRRLLLFHELAFLLLVIVTGALAGMWAYFWQQTSIESVRLGTMTSSAQLIRSDLFRQIKAVTLARLMEDPKALGLYATYSKQIESGFNTLRQHAEMRAEDQAIQEMQQSYRTIQHDMNNIFSDPYGINQIIRIKILNPRFEQSIVGNFETTFEAFMALLADKQNKLNEKMAQWTKFAPFILPVPVLLAAVLLVLSSRSVRRGFVRPMVSVIKGATLISEGRIDHKIPQQGVREMVELSTAINHMAEELVQSRDALVESERQGALGALVPVVAHNIRNPLATIRATAQLLDHVDEPEQRAEIRQDIIDTVDRLERWVSALVSYLHPLKPHPVPENPGEIVNTVLDMLETRLGARELQVVRSEWNKTYRVPVDIDLMEQAIYGLISNAIDASPRGAKLEIAIRRQQSQLIMTIEDNGPGMPFAPEPSGLSPGPTTKRFGTGLGIPVAFKVCSAHGWKLDFSKADKGGTRVTIRIPLDETQLVGT